MTNPRAKKKEMTISQITSLVNAEKAAEKESVLVTIEAVRPMKAQAPTGRGLRTRPAIVDRKIERSCQPCGVTPSGTETANRRIRPTERERIRGTSFAPCGG